MKIVACCTLHNGEEWLEYSLRSVRPYVDDIMVFFTPTPSHGHSTNVPFPENVDRMREIVASFDGMWDERTYSHEGHHRDFAYAACFECGADIVLVVDADEVWLPEDIRCALLFIDRRRDVKEWRVNMIHFWRSLRWMCRDNMWPLRIISAKGSGEGYIPREVCQPLHMGYAQSLAIIKYKMGIHGHRNEFRPRWYEEKFLMWEPGIGDVHPTCVDTWYPELYDVALICDVVGDHPYYDMEVIE